MESVICNCNKNGHKGSDCRMKLKRNNSSDTIIINSNIWCVGCNATRHICNDNQKFANDNEHSKVYTAAEYYVTSVGVGNVHLNAKINGHKTNTVKLQIAFYVSDPCNNLLSVSSVTYSRCTVI